MLVQETRSSRDSVWCAVPAYDGRRVVSGSCDHQIKTWDISSGELKHGSVVTCLDVSTDGKWVVCGGRYSVLRSMQMGYVIRAEIRRQEDHRDMLRVVKFSPDSRKNLLPREMTR